MKVIASLACALASLTLSTSIKADEWSVGLGVGTLYSGLGVNIAKRSDTDIKYVSTGCVSYSDLDGAECGVGAGWIKTDVFDFQNTHHGVGLYAGVVGSERVSLTERDTIYGGGIGYHYFFNGIDQPGTNLGVSFVAGDAESGVDSSVLLQIGYQF